MGSTAVKSTEKINKKHVRIYFSYGPGFSRLGRLEKNNYNPTRQNPEIGSERTVSGHWHRFQKSAS
jgi:hypothetical protein